ncbi:DNA gyrase subunit A [Candidatus Peregrinibacteria bacterium]|nr:DNA gyrase subunit A [Candidatus Peregrinibacteria bacterium]
MAKKTKKNPDNEENKKKKKQNELENETAKENNSGKIGEPTESQQEPLQLFDKVESICDRQITQEMETSYLEYAMSVIVSRALPDVRDGLKPVHRRILHAMNEIGLKSSGSFRKSAAVVGEVLAKYHPHGDAAVYDSMVRMAQDFAMRYQLVRGQGNFGSIDGDSPAAMRYTEAKMEKITDEMMNDIDKETVNWRDNYDGRYKEPAVLPTKLPQLLLNGSTGIAVGMATSIPPHNLGEVIDGVVHLSNNPEATIDDLMQFIKGPDFPTGGLLYNINDIKTAYATGRGGMVLRSKTEIVEKKNGKFEILVTEIPYQVNKANLITKMAELVQEKKIVGITDIRDESNKDGIRIVIELKKDSYPKKILNQLFKLTQLQSAFNMNMIALVDEIQPHLLDLKQVLEHFISHRKEVITRRTQFDLKQAQARAHILEGLKIAIDNIDAVIKTIRASETKEEALVQLMKKFKLTELQGKAILDMRLQTLAGLERQKIEDELAAKLAEIKDLESILKDVKKVLKIMQTELAEIKAKYADERRTQIVPNAVDSISQKDTIPNEAVIIMLSRENYIKRIPANTFRTQNRGGKGIVGGTTKEEDEIKLIKFAFNHDELLYFTNQGRVFRLPTYEIPKTSRQAKGQAIVNLLQLQENEIVTAILNSGEKFEGKYLFMATKKGTIKKTPVDDFKNVRKSGLIAIKLRPGDSLEWVKETNPGNEVVLVSHEGKGIRFNEEDARPMGRPSIGVRGMKLKGSDEVVEMDVVKDPNIAELLVIMENGLGKMTTVQEYRFQARGGSGVKTANITAKTGKIVGAKILDHNTDADLIIISKAGQVIRLHSKQIPSQGRTTQGVYLMRMRPNDKVASISLIDNKELLAAAALAGTAGPEESDQESIEEVEVVEEKVTIKKG